MCPEVEISRFEMTVHAAKITLIVMGYIPDREFVLFLRRWIIFDVRQKIKNLAQLLMCP